MPSENGLQHGEIEQTKHAQYLTHLPVSITMLNVRIPYLHTYERERGRGERGGGEIGGERESE
jgi:hypothetical protein